eukprot:COSAG03_NODE_21727_length_300_cov_0.840796_2_plen_48_part_01
MCVDNHLCTHYVHVIRSSAIYNDWPGNGAIVIKENGYKNFVPSAFNTF